MHPGLLPLSGLSGQAFRQGLMLELRMDMNGLKPYPLHLSHYHLCSAREGEMEQEIGPRQGLMIAIWMSCLRFDDA